MKLSMRTDISLSAVTLLNTVTGYKPPIDAHPENSTPSNETWPEEYGEIKYEMSLSTTVDPEDDRGIALTKAGGNNRQCKESIKTRELSNENEGIVFTQLSLTTRMCGCKVPKAVLMQPLLVIAAMFLM
jgi:hypothetical protein